MSIIRVMDEILANKIAAGEVVEKIASVVKELTENAIDAKAKNIKIILKDSGTELINIIDDGIGMDKVDAQNAFLRHATSKVYKEDDLYFINTLGFRGEALASIASVSEVMLQTYNGTESTKVHIKGGKVLEVSSCAQKKGTNIAVTNLFYNTPARLKYLKSEATELANCLYYAERLALSKTDIAFCLINNDKILLKTSGSGNLLKTMHEIYGKEISENALEFKGSNDDFNIFGFACKPHILKSNRNQMITILNNRVVKNNEINNAINDAYYTYKPDGKYPTVVLNIETDPTVVDVNIHPTKQDVKISKIRDLTSLITDTIKKALYNNLLIVKPMDDYEEENENEFNKIEESIKPFENQEQIFMDFEKKEVIVNKEIKALKLYPVGLCHGTYIVAENEDGIYLLDQHAAYERINYERYMQRLKEKEVAKISLLIPITLEYSASEYTKLMEKEQLINSLGIDFKPMGINTITITAHPTWLKEGYEKESLMKILDLVITLNKNFDRVKFEEKIAITLACKMSIKANMHISNEEIEYILNELVKCDNPYNCPHGRPTIIKFTIYELEKMFKRAMD